MNDINESHSKIKRIKDFVSLSGDIKIIIVLIHKNVANFINVLESKAPDSSNNRQKMESILTDYSFNLKTKFYGQ